MLEIKRHLKKAKPLPKAEEVRLIKLMDKGDEKAKELLYLAHARLIFKLANRFAYSYKMSVEDLYQEGCLAFMKALERFDTKRNVRLSTYSSFWLMAYMTNYCLKNFGILGIPATDKKRNKIFFKLGEARRKLIEKGELVTEESIAKELGAKVEHVREVIARQASRNISLDNPVGSDDVDRHGTFGELLEDNKQDPLSYCIEKQNMDSDYQKLQSALSQLDKREWYIIMERFMAGDKEDMKSLQELGDELSVSRERVRQLGQRALSKIKEYVAQAA